MQSKKPLLVRLQRGVQPVPAQQDQTAVVLHHALDYLGHFRGIRITIRVFVLVLRNIVIRLLNI